MLYIRADANITIATGHIMRCMSIAQVFRQHGEGVTFIIADMQSSELLEREQFDYICLYSEWDNLDSEIDQMVECIEKYKITMLMIDSYYVSEYYLSQLSRFTKTIYLDDLGKLIYPVHMLVNYNIYYTRFNYEKNYVNTSTKLILGCKYAPLRDEFSNLIHEFSEKVRKVLVTTGGADSYNIASKLLCFILDNLNVYNDLEYHIIVGKFNRNKEHLEKLAQKYRCIKLHYDVKRMSELMLQCDVAISAGGSTMYELCACSVPMITYSYTDNQLDGVKEFNKLGIAKYCGDIRDGEQRLWSKIFNTLNEYIYDTNFRKKVANEMKELIDGNGANRLYKEIIQCCRAKIR